MKLSKKQILYGLVLSAAIAALAYDQWPTPPTQPPPVLPVANDTVHAASASIPTADPQNFSMALIIERLRDVPKMSSLDDCRNPFVLPLTWKPLVRPPKVDAAVPKSRDFSRAHGLKMTFARNSQSMAMVDDQIVKIGESVDGYRLLRVSGRTATFAAPDGEETMLSVSGHGE